MMKILMPVDGSHCSRAAVAFVASRAAMFGDRPEVELLNVQPLIPPRAIIVAGASEVRAYRRARFDAVLKRASARLRRAGMAVQTRRLLGDPAPTVGTVAATSDADLIAIGSHGRTAFRRLLFGSVTTAVLARSRKPVLVVRGTAARKRRSLAVGIAIDGSRYGMAAVRHLLRHDALLRTASRIALIHVVPDFSSLVIPGFGNAPAPLYSPREILEAQEAAFERVMSPARRLFEAVGIEVETCCRAATSPGDEIATLAVRRRLDLLVMGTHGHGALKSVLLGSVAMRVAARCTTPLMLVPAR
jgi:nucleotide-binding universal stress UspA family protein